MSSRDIARAQDWTTDLVRWEASGWGDAGNAMRRVSCRTGIPFAKLWSLRYRPPKAIASHVFSALEAAHAAALARQLRKLAADADRTEALAPNAALRSVEEARALLRQAEAAVAALAEEGRS